MSKIPIGWLENELPAWVEKGLITNENSQNLLNQYKSEQSNSINISVAGLPIFGSLLIGLGIISIFAYNFDFFIELWGKSGKAIKGIISLLLLLIGQGLCFYARKYKPDSLAWSESGAVFWFLALGSALAIIGQTYALGGNILDFTKAWIFLSLPIMYLLNARVVSIFILVMIVTLKITMFFADADGSHITVWVLMLLWLPYYIEKIINHKRAVATSFLNWAFVLCTITFSIFQLAEWSPNEQQTILVVLLLSSSFWVFGVSLYPPSEKIWKRPFEIIGKFFVFCTLLLLSKFFFFQSFFSIYYNSNNFISPLMTLGVFIISTALLALLIFKNRERLDEGLVALAPLIVYIYFALLSEEYRIASVLFINLSIMVGAGGMFLGGVKKAGLGLANQGFSLIAVLIAIHFLSASLPLLVKGVIFIGIGVLFLIFNKLLVKKMRSK